MSCVVPNILVIARESDSFCCSTETTLARSGISAFTYDLPLAGIFQGVIYSFSGTTGSLYSVIDTELTVNKTIVFKYLNEHYTLIPGSTSNESMLQYRFTNSDRSIVISTMKVSETCFNIDYSFISK